MDAPVTEGVMSSKNRRARRCEPTGYTAMDGYNMWCMQDITASSKPVALRLFPLICVFPSPAGETINDLPPL